MSPPELSTAVGWLLASVTIITWVLMAENFYNRCVAMASRDRKLAERLKRFFRHRLEFRLVLRFLLLVSFFLIVQPWIAGTLREAPAADTVFHFLWAPVALWLMFDFIAPAVPDSAAVLLLRLVLPVLEALRLLLWLPIVFPFRQWWRLMERLSRRDERNANLEEEILSLVQQKIESAGEAPGKPDSEHRMILGILDLEHTLVHEVMTPRVDIDSIEDTTTVREAKEQILHCGHSRLPVFHDTIDHIIGIVHAKDLLNEAKLTDATPVTTIVRKPIFIPESKNIADLLAEFQQNRNHFAVVLDEYGGTAGIVTLEDIIEEILGDIRDEYDANEEQPTVKRLPDGSLIVDGRVPIGTIEEAFDLEFSDDDFETISGYVLSELGRIPAKGEKLDTPMLGGEVLDADQRRILQLRLIRKENPTEGL
ncbi:MAG: hemolysin family protein [Lentisphaeria bacterium]|jgi:CBS domain containing-hemolysin-like protein